MSAPKTYFVHRKAIHHGPWYLKHGEAVPAEVPPETVAAWLKAKFIAETAPTKPEGKK